MKALIFAAGLGTRLRPLTNNKPKALATFKGKTLLELTILKLFNAGYNEIVVNTHHFSEKIYSFFDGFSLPGLKIYISDETEMLLDTGGGLKKAGEFLLENADDFLIYNVDILCNIDLDKFRHQHINSNALASLAVMKRESSNFLLFDDNNNLSGWKSYANNLEKITRENYTQEYAFSGIHYISPKIFDLIDEEGKFGIIQLYLRLSHQYSIKAFDHSGDLWMDVGTIEKLKEAEKLF